MSSLTSIRDWLKFSCPAHRMERNLVSIRGPASPGSGWQAGGDHLRLPGYWFTDARADVPEAGEGLQDRKSTRLNSSHVRISYAVFCLKKKKNTIIFHLLLD